MKKFEKKNNWKNGEKYASSVHVNHFQCNICAGSGISMRRTEYRLMHSQSHIYFHCNRHQFSLALPCATPGKPTNRKHVKQCLLARSVCDQKTLKPTCMPSIDSIFSEIRCEFVTVSLEFGPQRVHNVVPCVHSLVCTQTEKFSSKNSKIWYYDDKTVWAREEDGER